RCGDERVDRAVHVLRGVRRRHLRADAGLAVMTGYARAEVVLRAGRVAEASELSAGFKKMATLSPMLNGFVTEWGAMLDGRIAIAEGRPDDAEPCVAVAVRTTSERGDMPDLAGVTELLALVRHAQGRDEVALRLLGLAQMIRGRIDLGDPDIRRLAEILGMPERLGITKAEALQEIRAEAGAL
ncbi:hypothetical protein ABZX92_29645, partial [Lentzea sp. NPDC006480]